LIDKLFIFNKLKEKKEDRILRELFRHKLENAEVTPSPSVSTELMHRLGRREFLHFNPAKFNIWYAGAVAVAGTALAIILFSGTDKKTDKPPVSSGLEIYQPVTTKDLKSGMVREAVQKDVKNNASRGRKRMSINSEEGTVEQKLKEPENTVRDNIVTSPADVVSPLPDKRLFQGTAGEKNKLRNSVMQGGNLIQLSLTEGCNPLKVRFKNMAADYDSCLWTFGDGGHSAEKDPEWLFDVPGEYEVILNVYGVSGLQATSSAVITVNPRPVARFEFIPENAVLPDDEIRFVNYSTDAIKYHWDFGDGNRSELFEPKHYYRKFGNYNVRLVAISESGCADSVTVMNAFSAKGYFIDFPNAFIPNPNGPSGGYYTPKSDEASQVFHPVSSSVSDYQLRIFSKRGILVFESNDINTGWDGYFKGQLSEPGVYIWKVRGKFINGEPFTKIGDVTLLKN
jgi:PKD repeat protein